MVEQDGSLSFRGQGVTRDELGGKLRTLAREDPANLAVTIWAEADCAYRDVAAVLRMCREAGIDRIQLAAASEEASADGATADDA